LNWHAAPYTRLLGRGGLPHALLLVGPQGIGKLAFAETVAASLLCERAQADHLPCGTCAACKWLVADSHPDFRRIEPATAAQAEDGSGESEKKASQWIGIDQVRALMDFLNLSSHRGGRKVVLLHPAESLNVNAANALLKMLEEPPPDTQFLLVATRVHLLPATIRSRCQMVRLPAPGNTAAIDWLKAQGIEQPDAVLAHFGGAPLLAVKHGAQDYWLSRGEFLRLISEPDWNAVTAAEKLGNMPPPVILEWLQKWSYDLAVSKLLGQVRYNPDHLNSIEGIALQVNGMQALRFHRSMVRLQRIAFHPFNARLFVEDMLLSYARLLAADFHAD